MDAVSAPFAKATLHEMLADYEAAAAQYAEIIVGAARRPKEAAAAILPLATYIGRFADPDLALKRAALEKAGGRFYPPYVPAARQPREGPAPPEETGGSPLDPAPPEEVA